MREESITNATDWAAETLSIITDAVQKLEAHNGHHTLNELRRLHRDILTTEITKLRKEVAMGFYGYESKRSLGDIVNIICTEYNVTPEEINSTSRKRQIMEARQVICWMIRNKAVANRLTLHSVGEVVGGKNHATVLHACNTVNDRIETEKEFKKDVQRWCSMLGAVTMYNEIENKLMVIGYEKVSTEKTEQEDNAPA